MIKQTFLLSFLLLLVCAVQLEALVVKSPRGVRGYGKAASRSNLAARGLQVVEDRKKDEDKDVEIDEDKDNDKDNQDDKNNDKNKNDAPIEQEDEDENPEDEDPEDAVISEAIETSAPTQSPTEEVEEEETDPPAKEDKNEQAEVEEEVDEEEQGGGGGGKDSDQETDEEPDESTGDASEEPTDSEISNAEMIPTDAPVEETTPSVETETATNATEAAYSYDLAPFSITIQYDEKVSEDPGLEEYLFAEMVEGGAYNLVALDLQLTSATVYGRRRLASQNLYYKGSATFEGTPVYEESQVLALQRNILKKEGEIAAVIAESLGVEPSTFVVSSISVEMDSEIESDEVSAEPEDEKLSTTGLSIIIVAAVIGGVSLTLIAMVALTQPSPPKPYDRTNRSIAVPSKDVAPELKAAEGPKEDLNKTFETEEEQVHEEFAQNMENHSFDGSWKNKGPVTMQASVGRGSYNEVSSHVSHFCLFVFTADTTLMCPLTFFPVLG